MTSRTARLAMLLALLLLGAMIPTAHAAGGTYYVDGKTGNDSDDGLSPSSAFKTIAKAADEVDQQVSPAGWVVEVKGYTDYIYRERPIPPGWAAAGTSGSPIVFRASGYVAGWLGLHQAHRVRVQRRLADGLEQLLAAASGAPRGRPSRSATAPIRARSRRRSSRTARSGCGSRPR